MMTQIPFRLLSVILVVFSHYSAAQTTGGDVKFMGGDSNIVFHEYKLQDTAHVSGTVRVFFKDSLNLVPHHSDVAIMRMKGGVNFLYLYSQKKRLNSLEKNLFKKYASKVDSIFLHGKYQFLGDKKWIVGNKLDFTYSFKLAPKPSSLKKKLPR